MCQGGADICSVRLVFSTFSLAAPVTTTVAETSGVSRTQCRDAQFAVNSDGENIYNEFKNICCSRQVPGRPSSAARTPATT